MSQPDLSAFTEISPDALHEPGVSTTFFYGITNRTLYINTGPGNAMSRTHRHTLIAHPEILAQVLPPDVCQAFKDANIYENFMPPKAGTPISMGVPTGKHQARWSGNAWMAMNSYAIIGRVGYPQDESGIAVPQAARQGVISMWPSTMGGIADVLGKDPGNAIKDKWSHVPELVNALMGRGKVVALDGKLNPVTPDFIVVSPGEYPPTRVADLLGGSKHDWMRGRQRPQDEPIMLVGHQFTSDEIRYIRGCCHVGAQGMDPSLRARTGITSREGATSWLCRVLSGDNLRKYPQLTTFIPSTCRSAKISSMNPPKGQMAWYQSLRNAGHSVHGFGEGLSFRGWLNLIESSSRRFASS